MDIYIVSSISSRYLLWFETKSNENPYRSPVIDMITTYNNDLVRLAYKVMNTFFYTGFRKHLLETKGLIVS